ncbi:hypothetical protein PTKIN_Ptkin14bG0203400 [Pterospermum kingtungense]
MTGFVKFNINGSSLGKPGLSGIGGILRDHDGNELIRFSKNIEEQDSNMAELMAVREATILFLSSKWVNTSFLTIESDSINVVCWVNNPCSAPWGMRPVINHIQNLQTK